MTATSEEVWFVLLQGEQLGPLSFEEVLDFYYKDVVSSETLLWRDGLSEWVPITQIPEFNELLFQGIVAPAQSQNQQPEEQIVGDTAFLSEQELDNLRNMSAHGHSKLSQTNENKVGAQQVFNGSSELSMPFADEEELEELKKLFDNSKDFEEFLKAQ